MTSNKQIQANRLNAQKGGVKTLQGKEISKFNSLKHGLLSKEVLLQGENAANFTQLDQSIRENLQPEGAIEMLLVERIIANVWRLRRILEIETAIMEYNRFDNTLPNVEFLLNHSENSGEQSERRHTKSMLTSDIDTLIRYETTIERSIYKALHELQRLQAARNGQPTPLPLAVDITVDGNIGKVNEEV